MRYDTMRYILITTVHDTTFLASELIFYWMVTGSSGWLSSIHNFGRVSGRVSLPNQMFVIQKSRYSMDFSFTIFPCFFSICPIIYTIKVTFTCHLSPSPITWRSPEVPNSIAILCPTFLETCIEATGRQ